MVKGLISLKNNSSLITLPLCSPYIVRRIWLQTCDKQGAKLDVQLFPLSQISDTPPPPVLCMWHVPARVDKLERVSGP